MSWTSNAQWPKGSVCQGKTTDTHDTEAQARAVCRMLERDGLGGEGKVFPLRTWAENDEPVPPEQQLIIIPF